MSSAYFVSYAIAIFIGIVVSLDVSGLLISQHREFRNSERLLKRLIGYSALHPATHAGLFLLYFYAVGWSINLPTILIEFLASLNFFPEIDTKEARNTVLLLSSMIIIAFVWLTYAGKIEENHAEKVVGVERAEIKDPDKHYMAVARIDVRLIYWLAKSVKAKGRALVLLSMALAVAVDMLAITSFIRVFFRIAPDAANSEGAPPDDSFHFLLAESAELEPLVFSLFIFIAVLTCSIVAIIIARSVSDERNKSILKFIRVLEPIFVFWILAMAVEHLFGTQFKSEFDLLWKLGSGLLVAILITGLLVLYHGWEKIRLVVEEGFDKLARSDESKNIPFDDTTLKSATKKFLVFASLTIMSFTFILVWSHRTADEDFNGLMNFLELGSIFIGSCALVFLFVPVKKLSIFEVDNSKGFETLNRSNFDGILNSTSCVFITYALMVFHIHFSFSGFSFFAVSEEETFFRPLVLIWLVGLLTWLLLTFRSSRVKFFPGEDHKEYRKHFERNLGDIFTAFACAILLFQLLSRVF